MIEILREPDLTRIGPYQGVLEGEGIRTFIRNETLSVAEVLIPAFYPALCVVKEEEKDRALQILRDYENQAQEHADKTVVCAQCGEESPGNFGVCWNCSSELPEPAG